MTQNALLYLWQERTLFIGVLDEPMHLSQGASTLSLSLGEPVRVKDVSTGNQFSAKSVLIPAGCSVEIDSKDQLMVNLNLDVMGEDFYHLNSLAKQHIGELGFNLQNEDALKHTLLEIYQQSLDSKQARAALNNLFLWKDNHFQIEERIRKAVRLIQSSIETNLSIDNLADQVNLSVSGLTKLFKKQTGVPIRRYRQWHRLYVTACEIGKGKSLTDAALTAGFVDLSHCTNTFTQMFGIKPSYFLLRPKAIKIMTELDGPLRCNA